MPAPLRPQVRFTGRAEGDFRIGGADDDDAVARRRRAVADVPWTWLRQVHGARVVAVEHPGQWAGQRADAAVTATPGAALSVQTADCAPVVLLGVGAIGIAHAGWRGLVAGVIEATVEAVRRLGVGPVEAVVGPCIRPECYEFGPADLDVVAAALGDAVRGRTKLGRPALDLSAAVASALARVGVEAVTDDGHCTACDASRWFSHRARSDRERQVGVVWLE